MIRIVFPQTSVSMQEPSCFIPCIFSDNCILFLLFAVYKIFYLKFLFFNIYGYKLSAIGEDAILDSVIALSQDV